MWTRKNFIASFTRRAERGAALLDQQKPGWWKDINPDSLDLMSNYDCVLGQVYGYFTYGADELRLRYKYTPYLRHTCRYGFVPLYRDLRFYFAYHRDLLAICEDMKVVWLKLVEQRRQQEHQDTLRRLRKLADAQLDLDEARYNRRHLTLVS